MSHPHSSVFHTDILLNIWTFQTPAFNEQAEEPNESSSDVKSFDFWPWAEASNIWLHVDTTFNVQRVKGWVRGVWIPAEEHLNMKDVQPELRLNKDGNSSFQAEANRGWDLWAVISAVICDFKLQEHLIFKLRRASDSGFLQREAKPFPLNWCEGRCSGTTAANERNQNLQQLTPEDAWQTPGGRGMGLLPVSASFFWFPLIWSMFL